MRDVGRDILHIGDKFIKGFSSLTAKVDGLTKDMLVNLVLPRLNQFMYTIKIDGMRTLLFCDGKNVYKF